jgi:hypothetical protein
LTGGTCGFVDADSLFSCRNVLFSIRNLLVVYASELVVYASVDGSIKSERAQP